MSYTYKSDATHKRQFGLIAADVDKVYPELVVNNARGEPEAVPRADADPARRKRFGPSLVESERLLDRGFFTAFLPDVGSLHRKYVALHCRNADRVNGDALRSRHPTAQAREDQAIT